MEHWDPIGAGDLVARGDAQEVRVSPLTAKHAEDTLAIDYGHLILQAQL